jgi:hypothetical protein
LVATATAAVASAASAAETAIEALLPSNFSLSISQFCVEFVDHTDCTSLPLNVSEMIPEAVTQLSEDIQTIINDQFQQFRYLEGVTAKVTSANIEGPLVFGLGFFIVFAATLFFCLFIKRFVANNIMKGGICLLAILCCIPFAVPLAILSYVESEIQVSGPIVNIEKGDATGLSIGALVCSIIMILPASVYFVFYKGDIELRA